MKDKEIKAYIDLIDDIGGNSKCISASIRKKCGGEFKPQSYLPIEGMSEGEVKAYIDLIEDNENPNGLPAWRDLSARIIDCPACDGELAIPYGISGLKKCPHCKNNVLFHDGHNNYFDNGETKALND